MGGGNLADEVLVLPTRHRPGPRHGLVDVGLAGRRDQGALAAGLAQVARQGPRVDAGDRRHARRAQDVHDLARPAEHRRGGMPHHQAAQPGSLRLVVSREAAVVADQRISHDHDLARVRRIGTDLLVARLAGIDHQVPARLDGRAERGAVKDGAILQCQQGRPVGADTRVHHGIQRDRQVAADDQRHVADTKKPPPMVRQWSASCRFTVSPSLPASLDPRPASRDRPCKGRW